MKRDFPRWFNLISILIIMGLSFVIVSCNSVTPPSASRTPAITADTLKEGEAVIDILTENETKILPEMMGVHNQITRQNYVINSNDFLKAAENFGRLGFIRWSGGTTNNAFNWKLGAIDAEYSAQTYLHKRQYYLQIDDKINVEAKGFDRISALREFLQKTGSKVMIVANVFLQTPEEIGDLAKYLFDNNIPVIYFELGNEVANFTGDVI